MQIDHHEGLSPAEFAMQVIERLNARYGIRLDSVLTNPALSLSQRRRQAQMMLMEHAMLDEDERILDHSQLSEPVRLPI